MRRLFGRFGLIQIVFLSAVFYASIPVIVALGSAELATILPTLLPLISGALSLPLLLKPRLRGAVWAVITQPKALTFFLGNAVTFVASLVFLSLAITFSNAPTAILIVESWPLFTALILAPMLGTAIRKLNAAEVFWGAAAVFGIMLALKPEGRIIDLLSGQWLGVAFALVAAALMGAAVGFKAWCTRYLKDRHAIDPIRGYFVMQLFFLPITLLALPVLVLTAPQQDVLSLSGLVSTRDLGLVGLIVVVNVISSVLFSYATLRMRSASDTYLWFFSPAISFGLYALVGPSSLRPEEILGLTFVVSANLISAIRDDTSLSFRALVVSLLAVGTICFLWPMQAEFDGYFDVLAVLSIFFVILLSFALDWSQRQREGLEGHMIELRAHLAALPVPARATCEGFALRMDAATHRSQYRRAHDLLARELARLNVPTASATLDACAATWRNDLRIGYFVALGAILLASLMIGLGARGGSWVHDLFATIYLSAMVFVFFFLIESVQARTAPVYQAGRLGAWNIRLPVGRRVGVTTIWTLVLSLFLVAVFAILFIQF